MVIPKWVCDGYPASAGRLSFAHGRGHTGCLGHSRFLRTIAQCSLPLLLALPAAVGAATSAPASSTLERGFRNPPPEARLRCYWWWLNGHVTKASIASDLEQMKAKGYGGAIVIDANGSDQQKNAPVPAGPLFGSPEWRELFRHALATADRLGLELSLNIVSGWNIGGPMVTPDYAAKLVTWSTATVKGPAHFDQPLAAPPAKAGWYRDIAVLAYPLHHGAPRAGQDGRKPIRQLRFKGSFKETGGSTPETAPLLDDESATPGEEDTTTAAVIDLTAKLSASGRLQWDAPAGEWEILRFGYTPSGSKVSTASGAWQGAVIDYLDHNALDTYWRAVLDPILADAKPYRSLKYLVSDSWELDGVNWTPRFREEFRRRCGYDLLPWLPVFTGRIVEDRARTNRFLNDIRRTIGDLVSDEHYSHFLARAAKLGYGTHPEAGGPHGAPVDSLEALGRSSFPQMEFWAKSWMHRVADKDRFFVKEASSAAHIYGKRLVGAEGFTTIGPHWEETIWDNLKPSFDRALCEGLNRLIWHTFTASPKELGLPGQEYFAGTHMNPNVTWWEQAGPWFAYINRSSFLLQQGLAVADALYYYGDHVPNFVRLKPSDPAHVLPGYDYDVTSAEALLTRAAVRDGRIVFPDGMSYRVLVLQDRTNISLPVLRKLRELVQCGATVIGPRPDRTTGLDSYPRGDGEVRALAAGMWGDCDGRTVRERRFGKGRIVCGAGARDVLARGGVPQDVEFQGVPAGASLDYVHRTAGDAEIYFVSSQYPQALTVRTLFRVAGKAPEFWDAAEGQIRLPLQYESAQGRTAVTLELEPYGSMFVVFRRAASERVQAVTSAGRPAAALVTAIPGGVITLEAAAGGAYAVAMANGRTRTATLPAPAAPVAVTGPWTVRFPAGWGAPATATFDVLRSYTEHSDPGIKYFSGTATYATYVELPAGLFGAGRALRLELGDVRAIATVRLNGRDLGILWRMPFSVDITAAARPGRNRLEVDVTNLWPNRLIGDQQLPEKERHTWTNIRRFTKDSPLLPSGLLGPVRVQPVARVELP
jgi:hypothetical protein